MWVISKPDKHFLNCEVFYLFIYFRHIYRGYPLLSEPALLYTRALCTITSKVGLHYQNNKLAKYKIQLRDKGRPIHYKTSKIKKHKTN